MMERERERERGGGGAGTGTGTQREIHSNRPIQNLKQFLEEFS